MTNVQAARLAWPLWAGVAVAWLVAGVVVPPAHDAPSDSTLWHIAFLTYGAMGALIVTRRPDNRVGWLFIVVGTFDPIATAVRTVAAANAGAFSPATIGLADWLQAWIWAPSMGALVLLVYVFPEGRIPRGRWRWWVWATVVATAVLVLVHPILAWPYRGLILRDQVPPEAVGQIVPAVAFGTLLASLVAGAVCLGRRFRRSSGTERLQLKWFVFGVAVLVAAMGLDVFILEMVQVDPEAPIREVLYATFVLPPISAGVAVLRHRLYEIDRIINRTAVYGLLTVVLGGAYLSAIAAMRVVTAAFTGDTAVAVAASTLAVAALFQPARRRIQAAVDRRFNRARYDAAATVQRFSTRLRDQVELEGLTAELIEVVGTTVQPVVATLWLREAR